MNNPQVVEQGQCATHCESSHANTKKPHTNSNYSERRNCGQRTSPHMDKEHRCQPNEVHHHHHYYYDHDHRERNGGTTIPTGPFGPFPYHKGPMGKGAAPGFDWPLSSDEGDEILDVIERMKMKKILELERWERLRLLYLEDELTKKTSQPNSRKKEDKPHLVVSPAPHTQGLREESTTSTMERDEDRPVLEDMTTAQIADLLPQSVLEDKTSLQSEPDVLFEVSASPAVGGEVLKETLLMVTSAPLMSVDVPEVLLMADPEVQVAATEVKTLCEQELLELHPVTLMEMKSGKQMNKVVAEFFPATPHTSIVSAAQRVVSTHLLKEEALSPQVVSMREAVEKKDISGDVEEPQLQAPIMEVTQEMQVDTNKQALVKLFPPTPLSKDFNDSRGKAFFDDVVGKVKPQPEQQIEADLSVALTNLPLKDNLQQPAIMLPLTELEVQLAFEEMKSCALQVDTQLQAPVDQQVTVLEVNTLHVQVKGQRILSLDVDLQQEAEPADNVQQAQSLMEDIPHKNTTSPVKKEQQNKVLFQTNVVESQARLHGHKGDSPVQVNPDLSSFPGSTAPPQECVMFNEVTMTTAPYTKDIFSAISLSDNSKIRRRKTATETMTTSTPAAMNPGWTGNHDPSTGNFYNKVSDPRSRYVQRGNPSQEEAKENTSNDFKYPRKQHKKEGQGLFAWIFGVKNNLPEDTH